jgi:hypothetical protein
MLGNRRRLRRDWFPQELSMCEGWLEKKWFIAATSSSSSYIINWQGKKPHRHTQTHRSTAGVSLYERPGPPITTTLLLFWSNALAGFLPGKIRCFLAVVHRPKSDRLKPIQQERGHSSLLFSLYIFAALSLGSRAAAAAAAAAAVVKARRI